MTPRKLSPLDLQKRFAMGLFGAEGETPSGMLKRSDAIATVPGTALTVDGQPLGEIWDELQSRLTAYNGEIAPIIGLFSDLTIRSNEQIATYSTRGFEQATEFGRPTNLSLQYLSRAFPIDQFDVGFGYTQKFIDRAKGREILAVQDTVENAWWNLLLNTVLLALYDDAPGVDPDGVQPLALYNADTEIPPPYKRWTHDGTHTHYLADAGAFTAVLALAMEEHLIHHGFGDFGEQLFLLVHRDEMAIVRGFTDFVPASTATVKAIVAGPTIGAAPSAQALIGLPVEGFQGKFAVVEMNDIPSGYPVGFATGGQFASSNVVRLRQHENPSARGLRLIEGPRQRYPLYDAVYDGYTGAGVAQRGAAVVQRTGNGTYAPPTF